MVIINIKIALGIKNIKKEIITIIMKKIFSIILFMIFTITICSCSSNPKIEASNMDHTISTKIMEIDNINNLNDETIKALSVVIRTQLINNIDNTDIISECEEDNNNEKNITIDNTNSNNEVNNTSTLDNNTNNDNLKKNILNLINETKNKIIINESNKKVNYVKDLNNYKWKKNIKKSDILNYLKNNNINLSNISNFEPYYTTDNKLSYIKIGGKNINYDELKINFNINSPNITKIDNNFSSITINGNGFDGDIFDIKNANNLANNNYNYEQLLNHFFNDFYLKTI